MTIAKKTLNGMDFERTELADECLKKRNAQILASRGHLLSNLHLICLRCNAASIYEEYCYESLKEGLAHHHNSVIGY